jgi:dipeptidase
LATPKSEDLGAAKMVRKSLRCGATLLFSLTLTGNAEACTNIIVTPGASANGSMMLTYSSDSHTCLGQLYHYPQTINNQENQTVDVYEWETGEFLGSIPQPEETYNVVGNCNEYNVCVGETTFGGPPELLQPHPEAMIDYGSLMYLTLQRSKTAKEALDVMTNLVETYGYHSEGESFSLVDPQEAYLLEMQNKGKHDPGAVWVACPVPDGTMVAHANHARITTFLNDDSCTYSKDVVDFAIQIGLYKPSSDIEGDYSDFSFSDVYNPQVSYVLRYTDARVWDIYRAFMSEKDREVFDEMCLSHVMGRDLEYQTVLPIWFVPQTKVTLDDMRVRMASHYEGTPLEYGSDVAAGLFEMPYKPRPNNWVYTPNDSAEEKPEMYVNERPVAVEKTGFNFIAEIRQLKSEEYPNGVVHTRLQTVYWYAQDDCSTSPRIPQFPSASAVSDHYVGVGSQRGEPAPLMEMDLSKSFWVQNVVSNLAYFRWKDIYPVLGDKLDQVQSSFEERVTLVERQIAAMIRDSETNEVDDDSIVEILTEFTITVGNEMHYEWTAYWGYLFVRFRDFVTMSVNPDDKGCGCDANEIGISHEWQTRIVEERPEHWEVSIHDGDQSEMAVVALEKYQREHPHLNKGVALKPQKSMLVEEGQLADKVAEDVKIIETSQGSHPERGVMDSSQPWFASHPLSKSVLSMLGH